MLLAFPEGEVGSKLVNFVAGSWTLAHGYRLLHVWFLQVSEMIELYVAKGMSLDDATEVISRLARYRPIFLEAMMKVP